MGLGPLVTRILVELMGGRISLRDISGGGVHVALEPPLPDSPAPSPSPTAETVITGFKGTAGDGKVAGIPYTPR